LILFFANFQNAKNKKMTNFNENNDNDDDDETTNIVLSERLFDTNYYETLENDNTYYITVPYRINNNYLKDLHISSRGFFNNSVHTIKKYIREYTISAEIPDSAPLEIVKTSYINLPNGFTMANIIIKTFWIKIVQRRWRKVFQKRKEMIQTIRTAIINREYRSDRFSIPKLRGCLADMK
jgi:hypothetical protein